VGEEGGHAKKIVATQTSSKGCEKQNSFTCKCFLEWQHHGISWILSDGEDNVYLLRKVERFEGLFVWNVVCFCLFGRLFALFAQFCQKSCGSWHLCNVNWIVSSITIYNMWQLMWHIVHKKLQFDTNWWHKLCDKKSFSWLFLCDKKNHFLFL
jgi:hypothetical protein